MGLRAIKIYLLKSPLLQNKFVTVKHIGSHRGIFFTRLACKFGNLYCQLKKPKVRPKTMKLNVKDVPLKMFLFSNEKNNR